MAKALVITPTTGSPELQDAIDSILDQTIETDHLLVCDGNQYREHVERIVADYPMVKVCYLPYNTGGNGFYGHRIMAAFSHLVNHDYVLFLDQDNWFQKDHVASMVEEIEKYNVDWCYSLRSIYDKDNNFICLDNCESLGRWPAWVNPNAYLIDSSSYCFKTSFIRQYGHVWDDGWGADRKFYWYIKDHMRHQNYTCTGKYTLSYRLGGNEGSVTADFFLEGNKKMQDKYMGSDNNGKRYPWQQVAR